MYQFPLLRLLSSTFLPLLVVEHISALFLYATQSRFQKQVVSPIPLVHISSWNSSFSASPMKVTLHYFSTTFQFFLSQLHTAAENEQHQMLVLLPMASAQWIAMPEEFLTILGISAVMHRNTRIAFKEFLGFWEESGSSHSHTGTSFIDI